MPPAPPAYLGAGLKYFGVVLRTVLLRQLLQIMPRRKDGPLGCKRFQARKEKKKV